MANVVVAGTGRESRGQGVNGWTHHPQRLISSLPSSIRIIRKGFSNGVN